MSDLMLFGILEMPYALAMSDELSRMQFHARAKQACDQIRALEDEVSDLRMCLDAASHEIDALVQALQ